MPSHRAPLDRRRRYAFAVVAANFLPQSVAAAAVALSVGRVIDRVYGRAAIPACMALLTASLLTLRLVDGTPTALVYGLILGSAAAAVGASEGTLLARWLGIDQLGRIRGRLMATIVTASAVGPLAFTLLAEAFGSYTSAATIAAALPIVVGITGALAPLPEHTPMPTDLVVGAARGNGDPVD